MTTTRWGRQLKARREQGLCGWKRCSKHSGDEFHCAKHAAEWAAYMRKRRKDKKRGAGEAGS